MNVWHSRLIILLALSLIASTGSQAFNKATMMAVVSTAEIDHTLKCEDCSTSNKHMHISHTMCTFSCTLLEGAAANPTDGMTAISSTGSFVWPPFPNAMVGRSFPPEPYPPKTAGLNVVIAMG